MPEAPTAIASGNDSPHTSIPSTESPDPHAGMPRHGAYAGHLHFDASVSPVLHTDVDVAAYVRRGSTRLPVDAAAIAQDDPLPVPVLRALWFLQRLEASALGESRAMLATATGDEARITAFLATWMVDRYWHARALRDVLTAGKSDVDRRLPHLGNGVRGQVRRFHVDHVQPLLTPLWRLAVGENIAAGHMARLAIQEASLQSGLTSLSRRMRGEAQRVLQMVVERHQAATDFFTAEAIARIVRSPREAATARVILAWNSPLDGGGLRDPDVSAALAVIGEDPRDRAALHAARREITRLLPGPDLPDPHLASLSRRGESHGI